MTCAQTPNADDLGSKPSCPSPGAFTNFNNNIIFYPASDAVLWKTLYARSLQLADETLLLTWENYPKEPPLVNHPIWKSLDGGATYSPFSTIEDQVNGWGMRFQPCLYTLPKAFAGYQAGAILAAGVSCPFSLVGGVYIDLYVSQDEAKTWTFLSHVAYGDGPQKASNGNAALWEPFLMMYEGQLICYFADQRDPLHGQKCVHVTTTDLLTWSDLVNDVADTDYVKRPGMPVVAHIESTGQYILTYETCGIGCPRCPVYYKISANPLEFGLVKGNALVGNNPSATIPNSGPFVIWTPNSRKEDGSGVIIVSASNCDNLFINDDNADPNGWRVIDVGQAKAYTRSMRIIILKGQKKLLFSNGGNIGDLIHNTVSNGVVEVPY